ncbi:unnamed protein product [Cyclocybe aegerita]|uniref:Uncharacterized protein n=1 Tax=Cyclocybe aegerita TaxID=1973307 RepID=A0A8S0VYN4_CYCAE|nr:unnamed protein product [Cyclocybe aegerita]
MTATQLQAQGRSEEDSLLPGRSEARKRRSTSRPTSSIMSPSRAFSWKAHPFWLIPVVIVMSISRGFTMSPRIQVYQAIACRALGEDSPGMDFGDLANFATGCNDPKVAARVAKIQASVVTTMSVLSAISTGFWSRLGDAYGRKLILCTFLTGALLMEAVFVLVMRPNTFFGRYAEQLILVGPVIEGFVGGLSTFNGVVHAYISDCTRHGSRSKIFSTVQGMVFVGLATGPWICGKIFPPKGYHDGFFFGSISLIAANILFVIFICPESRFPPPATDNTLSADQVSFKNSPLLAIQRLFVNFLSSLMLPISMFMPLRVPGSSRRNYNMTLVGLSLFLYIVSTGVYSAKYLYGKDVFKWTTAELGYYMSTLWISRAINLLLFLPIVLSYLKPKSTTAPGQSPNARDISAELNFDRYLASLSLFVDGLADSLVAITASRSQTVFYTLSCLSSFTSGGNPALHSLGAVCLHACGRGSEVGALFGALGVLSAIGHIISPTVYAVTYGRSVANYPEAIFALAACILFSVVLFLSRVSPAAEDIALALTPRIGEERRTRSIAQDYSYEALPENSDDEETRN